MLIAEIYTTAVGNFGFASRVVDVHKTPEMEKGHSTNFAVHWPASLVFQTR